MEIPTRDRPPLPHRNAGLPDHVLEAALDVWSQARSRHVIPITGSSMLPLIWDGDHVLVAHGPAGVRRGDVIVFRCEGRLVAHRVLCIYGDDTGITFVTKGDNALHLDPPVNADEMVGRVLSVRRGKQSMSLDTPAWRRLGWLIAVSTLAWIKLYAQGRDLKHGLLGPQPSRLTPFLRRGALACFSLVLKVMQAIAGRWKK